MADDMTNQCRNRSPFHSPSEISSVTYNSEGFYLGSDGEEVVNYVLNSTASESIKRRARVLSLSGCTNSPLTDHEVSAVTGLSVSSVRHTRKRCLHNGIYETLSDWKGTPAHRRLDGLVEDMCAGIENRVVETKGVFLDYIHVMHGKHWIKAEEHEMLSATVRKHIGVEIQIHLSVIQDCVTDVYEPGSRVFQTGAHFPVIHEVHPAARAAMIELNRMGLTHVHVEVLFLMDVDTPGWNDLTLDYCKNGKMYRGWPTGDGCRFITFLAESTYVRNDHDLSLD